ncbi:MAG: GNAT family N-acetyltransferase [Rhizobiaceae bacterium]
MDHISPDKGIMCHIETDTGNTFEPVTGLNLLVSIETDPEAIQQEWVNFENRLGVCHSVSCWSLAWYSARSHCDCASPYIVVGRSNAGELLFVLPLEMIHLRQLKVLMSPGAGQSTYFTGLFSQSIKNWMQEGKSDEFWSQVFEKIRQVDALFVDGFSRGKFGASDPLYHLPFINAAHTAMEMAITADWPKQYEQMFSKKARANDRRCERRLREIGTLNHKVSQELSERQFLLEAMFRQKSEQFASQRMKDPYHDPEIRSFYNQLVKLDAEQDESVLYISALYLDDDPIAINFGVLENGELQGLITSMTIGELKRFAPGRLLLAKTNAYLSDHGIFVHDFGMGEFAYKVEWCDRKIERQHVAQHFTKAGSAYLIVRRLKESIRSHLNDHPALKQMLKTISSGGGLIGKS